MWAGTRQLEEELVRRRGWIGAEQLRLRLVMATLMPSAKFVGLAGLVGFQLRGWLGSITAVGCILAPGSLLALMAAALLHPGLLAGRLAPVHRTLGVTVVGILLANAWRQLELRGLSRPRQLAGLCLATAVAVAIARGVPLLATAAVGLALGWAVLGGATPK